eukprot:4764859-Pyramimonas_sp.AAC.1
MIRPMLPRASRGAVCGGWQLLGRTVQRYDVHMNIQRALRAYIGTQCETPSRDVASPTSSVTSTLLLLALTALYTQGLRGFWEQHSENAARRTRSAYPTPFHARKHEGSTPPHTHTRPTNSAL